MERLSQSPTEPVFVQNPYPFYEKARAAGDFVFWEDYGLICATSARAVSAVLRDRSLGRTPPPEHAPQVAPHTEPFYAIEANSMLELEPPTHTRLRGLVLRAFTSRRIANLAPEIEQLSRQLAAGLPDGPFDLIDSYCAKIPVIIIARLLGIPETMADQLLDWSHKMVAMYQAGRVRADEIAAGLAAREFAEFLETFIEDRRSRPADDLITHLIAAEEDGQRLSTDEMISTCILLLNAGHEATVHSLGNGVKAILEHDLHEVPPDQAAGFVEEILRYDPPLHLFTRWVNDPVVLAGQSFEKGQCVAALLGSAGRDPALTQKPDIFDPFRPPVPHNAFGAGVHFCVGAPLARLEMQIGLSVLFEARPKLKIAREPVFADIYHFHGLEQLLVET